MAAKKARKARKATKSRSTGATRTKAGFVSTVTDDADIPDYVVVELRYEAPVAFSARRFAAPAAAEPQADSLNEVLSKFDIKSIRSQFHLPADAIRSRVEVAATLPSEPQPARFAKRGMDTGFIQSGFVQVVPKAGADAKKIATALKRQKAVWDAYVAPRPVPAMPAGSAAGSRNFEPSQGYLYDAPDGIGAEAVWGLAGAKGSGITICDIEGNWNRQHEDLPSGIPLLGGTVINDLGWRNHGTAVLGEMISIPDARGCVGISHQAKGAVHSAVINGVFNAAGAISNAAAQLKKGDVILIELHAPGPTGNYVAMQYWSDIFSAIKATVDKGITVVEAAGNGHLQRHRPAEGQRRHRGRRRRAADQPCRLRRLRRRPAVLRLARRSQIAHLLFQLRQDRQRSGLGLACGHAGLWRCPGRRVGKYLVHAALLRHVERVTDRYRRGGVPAGAGQGEERRAHDTREGEGHIDDDGNTAAGGTGRSVGAAYRTSAQPG
jgi:hypothetical protein